MDLKPLPRSCSLRDYTKQAKSLLDSFKAGDRRTLGWLRRYHPKLPGRADTNDRNALTDLQIRRARLSLSDAQWIIARMHQFGNWSEFARALTGTVDQFQRSGGKDEFHLAQAFLGSKTESLPHPTKIKRLLGFVRPPARRLDI
jgi:hypothetical protein